MANDSEHTRHAGVREPGQGDVPRGRGASGEGVPLRDRPRARRTARLPVVGARRHPGRGDRRRSPGSATTSTSPTLRAGETVVDLGQRIGHGQLPRRPQGRPQRSRDRDRHDRRTTRKGNALAGRAGFEQRRVPHGLHRGSTGRGRLGRRRDQQRRDQSLGRQGDRLQRSRARAAPRRQARDRGHRHVDPAAGGRQLRRLALGRLYRRRDATRRLPADDRRRRLHRRDACARTSTTASSPNGPTTQRRNTASRASRSSL